MSNATIKRMMRLPVFTEPNPSSDWLAAEQQRLHDQADKMMAATRVMDVFARHGKLSEVGGSYLYGLMIYPDLDIDVTAAVVTKESFAHLLADLARHQNVRRISAADTVHFNVSPQPGPKGYWIGIEVPFEGDRWGIDCWFQQPDWKTTGEDSYASRLADLDDAARITILAIKYDLIRRGLYGKQYMSGDVYDAVLDKNVRSVEAFNKL